MEGKEKLQFQGVFLEIFGLFGRVENVHFLCSY